MNPIVVVTSPQNRPNPALTGSLLYRGRSISLEDEPTWKELGLLFVWC